MAYKFYERHACISCLIVPPTQSNYFSPHLAVWWVGNDGGVLLPHWAGRFPGNSEPLLDGQEIQEVHACVNLRSSCHAPFPQAALPVLFLKPQIFLPRLLCCSLLWLISLKCSSILQFCYLELGRLFSHMVKLPCGCKVPPHPPFPCIFSQEPNHCTSYIFIPVFARTQQELQFKPYLWVI